jgi:hypothetical protein
LDVRRAKVFRVLQFLVEKMETTQKTNQGKVENSMPTRRLCTIHLFLVLIHQKHAGVLKRFSRNNSGQHFDKYRDKCAPFEMLQNALSSPDTVTIPAKPQDI